MNKSSVALKIFYRTFTLFFLIVVLQVIFFSFMFESFHENRRLEAMQEAIQATSEAVETSAAGRMDTLLARFNEDEGVYTEAFDLSVETVFTVSDSDTFTIASKKVVMPPYVEQSVYDDTFEVGANIDYVRLVPHMSEAVYFPVEIVLSGTHYTYNAEEDILNLKTVFDFTASYETYENRLVTKVDRSTERFASLHQIVISYLVDEDIETHPYTENGREGEYFKTEYAFGDYYVFITPLEVNNVPYTLFTVMPIEPVYTFIADVLIFLGFTALITLGLLAGLTYLNARSIARPLKQLNAGVSRIANLDFTPLEATQGSDEIATLARNIEMMRENLEDSMERLNAQNARLKESLERENTFDKERKDFIASLSHEMKTPLSVIEASSEALRDGVFETEAESNEQLELIQKEIQKSKALIEGIMDTYKIDRPSYLEAFTSLDLHALVKHTVEDNHPILKKHAITPHIKGESPTIDGDPEKLTLALSNLLTNAARHTKPKGTVIIELTQEKQLVRLTMINKPATMDQALIKAFDEQKTLKQISKTGGGVGLHIVRLIIDQHKAKAFFENKDGAVYFHCTFKAA